MHLQFMLNLYLISLSKKKKEKEKSNYWKVYTDI